MPTRKLLIDLEDDVEDVLDLFRKDNSTSSVSQVTIEYWGEESVGVDQLTSIFDAVSELPELKQLHVNLGECEETKIPLHLLTTVIRKAKRLSFLCWDSVILTGTNDADFAALANAAREHTSLTCVCLSTATATDFEGDVNQLANNLEPFLLALAALRTMQVLELDEVPMTKAVLQGLSQSKTLEQIELWNIPKISQYLDTFVAGLKENTNIQKLEICSCDLDAGAGHLLVDLLRHNKHIRSAVLEINWGNVMFGGPISTILRDNDTLTELYLMCIQNGSHCHVDSSAESYASMICGGLERNSKLRRFTLDFQQSRAHRNDRSRLASAFIPRLTNALQKNFTLEGFRLTGGRSCNPIVWNEEIQFSLQLNQAGRSEWRRNDAFIENVLSIHQHGDLNTLFYLLSMHPPLVVPSS